MPNGQAVSRDNYGKLMEPGLRKIFMDNLTYTPWQFTQIFNVNKSTKAIETDLRMGDFGLWVEKGTLDNTMYEDPVGTDLVQYRHRTFSKGFTVEKESIDDDQYGKIKKFAKKLGVRANQTVDIDATGLLNRAWTPDANAYKGEALIGNHTRLDGGTRTNSLGALALNEPNLEIAHKLAAEQTDENGFLVRMNPDTLVIPRALEMTARKIFGSVYMPDAGTDGNTYAKNDINPFKSRYKIVVLDYLTDPNAWFLMDSKLHELNFFWREKPNFKNTQDFDSDIAKFKGRMRYSYGWTSDIGILGSKPTP
jgi:phage major head subunit gpT-like protein